MPDKLFQEQRRPPPFSARFSDFLLAQLNALDSRGTISEARPIANLVLESAGALDSVLVAG